MTRYRIHIEEIVVDGVDVGSRAAFGDAVRRELEAAIGARLPELAARASTSGHVDRLQARPVRGHGGALASEAAQSIVGSLVSSGGSGASSGGGQHGD